MGVNIFKKTLFYVVILTEVPIKYMLYLPIIVRNNSRVILARTC